MAIRDHRTIVKRFARAPTSVPKKATERRKELSADVQAFLAAGGQIDEVPVGQTGGKHGRAE